MALTKEIEFQNGILCENAYVKIERIEAYKDFVYIWVSVYANEESRNNGKSPIKTYSKKISSNNESFIPIAYDLLKTSEDFVDAKNC